MTQELGDAPIEALYQETMDTLAQGLEGIFNGDAQGADRKTGWVLMVFPFGDGGRCNYISNADREDVVALMKEQIQRLEGLPSSRTVQ